MTMEIFELHNNNSLNHLKEIKSNFIDCVITSPPYDNIRSYNHSSIWNFDIFKNIADELHRVLKDGGTIVWIVSDATIDGSETGTLQFLTRVGGSNAVRMALSGSYFGIGTASPSEKLHVYGEAGGGYIARFQNDGNNANRYGIVIQAGADDGSGTTNYILFEDGDGGDVGVASNDSGTFSVSDLSDARKKKNIRDTKVKGLDSVNAIKVRDFEWIKNDMSVNAGLVAQELEEVFPDAVTEFGDDDLLAVSRERLVPVLIKAVQELSEKVEELEKKCNDN